ncbi:hypothetical protein MASR1M60_31380 [Rhodocyclaceae bacterium]
MEMSDLTKQMQQLIAKCWADEAFKQRLLADPVGTLKAEGIAVPEGVRVRVMEDTAQEVTLVIPARSTELSDEVLSEVAGGPWLCFHPGSPGASICPKL